MELPRGLLLSLSLFAGRSGDQLQAWTLSSRNFSFLFSHFLTKNHLDVTMLGAEPHWASLAKHSHLLPSTLLFHVCTSCPSEPRFHCCGQTIKTKMAGAPSLSLVWHFMESGQVDSEVLSPCLNFCCLFLMPVFPRRNLAMRDPHCFIRAFNHSHVHWFLQKILILIKKKQNKKKLRIDTPQILKQLFLFQGALEFFITNSTFLFFSIFVVEKSQHLCSSC